METFGTLYLPEAPPDAILPDNMPPFITFGTTSISRLPKAAVSLPEKTASVKVGEIGGIEKEKKRRYDAILPCQNELALLIFYRFLRSCRTIRLVITHYSRTSYEEFNYHHVFVKLERISF